MKIFSIVVLILAAALLVIGLLATIRKLPGNSIIGLKVPEVRKSKEIWDVSHAVAGPWWSGAGVSLLFGGVLCFGLSTLPALVFLAFTIFMAAVFLGIGANTGAKAAHLMDRKLQEEGGCGDSCNCGDGGCSDDADKPEVDVAALRKAMEQQ